MEGLEGHCRASKTRGTMDGTLLAYAHGKDLTLNSNIMHT